MIWRVRDRRTFGRLRANGIRSGDGPLSVVFVPDDPGGTPPRVAFALGRRLGPAVVRNRLRRRLRSIFVELTRDPEPLVRSGAYLITARPEAAALRYQEVKLHVERALQRINDKASR